MDSLIKKNKQVKTWGGGWKGFGHVLNTCRFDKSLTIFAHVSDVAPRPLILFYIIALL